MEHPLWLHIGAEVEIERRIGRSVAWRADGVVVRHTKTQVVVLVNKAEMHFRPKAMGYHAVPRYLDYTTTLNPRREKNSSQEEKKNV